MTAIIDPAVCKTISEHPVDIYNAAFNLAMTFGVVLCIIGFGLGFLAGYGFYKNRHLIYRLISRESDEE